MSISYKNIERIEGPLLFVRHRHQVKIGTIVKIKTPSGSIKNGRILQIYEELAVIEVFEGTDGLDNETEVVFLDELFKISITQEMRSKVFDGQGRLRDSEKSSKIIPEVIRDINGSVINPVARELPTDFIQTGISAIDALNTIVRGQKLPIFSGQGLPHNQLVAQIVKQARISNEKFLIIFVGIGILLDDAMYFQKKFKESGNLGNVISFLNLASDPAIERILIPRIALTTAEYFAFDLEMHVLVIMTDITNYCEALRELSSAKGEIPSRKGYPGYLYSDLASIYERAGRIKGKNGTITLIPIISMPNDDITHPIPDQTAYITEGQIVLSRELHRKGIYPPIDILSSFSRMMNWGINTREDHIDVANQLNALYSHSMEIQELKALVGESSLAQDERKILEFKEEFDLKFINQDFNEERSIIQSLEMAWELLSKIPKNKLFRIKDQIIEKYYKTESNQKNKDTII